MRVPKRATWPVLALLALACSPADDADMPAEGPEDESAAEVPETVPSDRLEDWSVHLDSQTQDPAGFQMVTEGDGFTVQTGPAGIAWRPADLREEGDFTASARFTEMGAPADHREAYGIIVGGRHLDSPDQQYTYFLVRGDGSYLVKRRDGEDTSDLVGWTSSDAVQSVEAEGQESANELAVRVAGDQVEFVVNGNVVETLPTGEVEPWGVAGIRINHNLQVGVADWSVTGAAGGPGAVDSAPGAAEADSAAPGGG